MAFLFDRSKSSSSAKEDNAHHDELGTPHNDSTIKSIADMVQELDRKIEAQNKELDSEHRDSVSSSPHPEISTRLHNNDNRMRGYGPDSVDSAPDMAPVQTVTFHPLVPLPESNIRPSRVKQTQHFEKKNLDSLHIVELPKKLLAPVHENHDPHPETKEASLEEQKLQDQKSTKAKLSHWKAEAEEGQRKVKVLTDENTELIHHNSTLQCNITELEKQLDLKDQEINEMHKKIKSIQEDLDHLESHQQVSSDGNLPVAVTSFDRHVMDENAAELRKSIIQVNLIKQLMEDEREKHKHDRQILEKALKEAMTSNLSLTVRSSVCGKEPW